MYLKRKPIYPFPFECNCSLTLKNTISHQLLEMTGLCYHYFLLGAPTSFKMFNITLFSCNLPGVFYVGVAPPRPPMKEGLLSRPPGGPYPGRGGMAMHAPRPLLQPSPMAGGCVLMVYGLHEHKMNCDRVFNILCCYGNVLKV